MRLPSLNAEEFCIHYRANFKLRFGLQAIVNIQFMPDNISIAFLHHAPTDGYPPLLTDPLLSSLIPDQTYFMPSLHRRTVGTDAF